MAFTKSATWSRSPAYKDAPSDLAIVGRYILTPDIFHEIENTEPGAGGEIQITDAMRALLKKRPFYAVRFEGTRHDAGDKLGFLIATVEFALKREGFGRGVSRIFEVAEFVSRGDDRLLIGG
jgi:UTP--glucose-1-phosphate uridylyltransferase